MDDLSLLRRMVGAAPVLDGTTRARMRASLDARIERAPAPKRGSRRSAVTVVLVAVGVGLGTIAAAAAATHLWSQNEPVAIAVLPGDRGDDNSLDISNPMEVIASAAQFEATVAEFAPAIRLPEGHDFTSWIQHVERVTGSPWPMAGGAGTTCRPPWCSSPSASGGSAGWTRTRRATPRG